MQEGLENKYNNNIFENIKHIDEYDNEFWLAHELQKVLEYKDWRNFQKVINKAITSAWNSISVAEDWLVEVNKPIKTGKGKEEIVKDFKLSRYICYLIVQGKYTLQKVATSAGVKNMAELHTFTLSVNEWCDKTNTIGIYSKRVKYGGDTFCNTYKKEVK